MGCSDCGAENRATARFCAMCGSSLVAICPECGTEAAPGARFCDGCGTPLGAAPAATTAPAGPVGGLGAGEDRALVANRYQLLGLLGEGSWKQVHRARDTRLGREVALALLREGLDPAALNRFRSEATAMASLGEHPNLVTVYDAGDHAGTPWMASRLMTGGTAAGLLAGAEDGLPVARAAAVARDVAAALAHVHQHGLVHRDVKLDNVWLAADGTAVLGDFGLALSGPAGEEAGNGSSSPKGGSRLDPSGSSSPKGGSRLEVVGSVVAIAPEVVRGEACDHRADLYGLGVLLYELLAGRAPFTGDDAAEILAHHLSSPPPGLDRAGVPGRLEALVASLLAKDPDDRPPSAASVVDQLEQAAAVVAAPPPPQAGGPRTVAYVGRGREQQLLREALDTALSGRGGLVMLTGEPGIGKTRTAEELAAAARQRGVEVLWGRCHEGEVVTPYLPFTEPLRTWAVARSVEQLQTIAGEDAGPLATLVPELAQRLPGTTPARSDDPEGDRARLFDAVTGTFLRAADHTPLLLVLDDLHWADRSSLQLLLHLTRRLGEHPLLVVGTYRDVEVGRRHPLGDVLEDLRREHLATRVALRGLTPEDITAWLEASAQHTLGRGGAAFAKALYQRTEGNPFFVEEIVRDLIESGGIYRVDGRWKTRPLDELRIPEGVRQVIGRRLSRLSDPANTALTDAAVLGRSFSFETLAAMGPYDRDELGEHLSEAQSASLVVATGTTADPTYAFTHALVRETLYEELSLPRAQRRHLAAGQAIERVHAAAVDERATELAAHFRAAGAAADAVVALQWSLRAGELAGAVSAWEEAISHLEAALELLLETGEDLLAVARLRERLGDLHYVAGFDLRRGLTHLEQALATYEEAGDTHRAARVHSRLGRGYCTHVGTTDIERALAHFKAAETVLAEEGDSVPLAYTYAGIAAAGIWGHLPEEGAAAGERGAAMARRLGRENVWSAAAANAAWHLGILGRIDEALAQLREVGKLARGANHGFGAFQTAWIEGGLLNFLIDLRESADVFRRELEHPRTAQAPHQRVTLRSMLVFDLFELGELADCQRLIEEGVEGPFAASRAPLARGEWDEAFALLEEDRRVFHAAGATWLESGPLWTTGRMMEHLGRVEEARERFLAAHRLLDSARWPCNALWNSSDLARVGATLGRIDEAREHLARAEAVAASGQDFRGLAAAPVLARAAVAAATDDDATAQRAFDEALAVYERFEAVWFQLLTLQLRGQWQLQRGDRAAAAGSFDAGLELLQRIGAGAPWHAVLHAMALRARGVDDRVPVDASVELVAASIDSEHPDLRPHAAPDGTLTILFTDIEDSTALAERLGDRRWMEVLRGHNAIVRKAVAEHGGFEVKSLGDGFMLVFPSATRALRCARAVRDTVAAESWPGLDPPLRVRIGVHTGEPISEDGDFYGSQVNFAARLAAGADGGQILVSELTSRLVGDPDLAFAPLRAVELRGFAGQHPVAELL